MKFSSTKLSGPVLIQIEPHRDDRGFFARTFCIQEFESNGLLTHFVQHNISYNVKSGTLRGMHFQVAPHEEVKVVSCPRGSIYDVVVDIRKDSKTYLQWVAFELSAENHSALYIPTGFAHGFQTLTDHTEVQYLMGSYYVPDAARGLRWDDPAINILWPLPVSTIADKDSQYELIGKSSFKSS